MLINLNDGKPFADDMAKAAVEKQTQQHRPEPHGNGGHRRKQVAKNNYQTVDSLADGFVTGIGDKAFIDGERGAWHAAFIIEVDTEVHALDLGEFKTQRAALEVKRQFEAHIRAGELAAGLEGGTSGVEVNV